MSEMECNGQCPFCKSWENFIFSGSGSKGTCPNCGKNIKSYHDLREKAILNYSG